MDNVKTIADLALATAAPHETDGVPFVLIPEGAAFHSLESLLLHPQRKRGAVKLDDPASFVAYVNAHKDAHTRIFADLAATTVLAVLDHHESGSGKAGWQGHTAVYACPKSPEWSTWLDSNKQALATRDDNVASLEAEANRRRAGADCVAWLKELNALGYYRGALDARAA
jgi:uncharacterized protein YfdQ (DUF2303 family)